MSATCRGRLIAWRSAHFDLDYTRGAFAVGNDLQCEERQTFFERRHKAPIIRIRPRDRAIAAAPLARASSVSFVEVSPSTVMELKVRLDRGIEGTLQQRRCDGCVGNDVSQHRRHIGMNHSRAFGAAEQADGAARKECSATPPTLAACRWS